MYEHFGFEWTAEGEASIRGWHGRNPQDKHGLHVYSASDYGLIAAAMTRCFAPYIDRYQVPQEGRA